MGKYWDSWFHEQHSPWQTLNLKNPWLENNLSAHINPYTDMISTNRGLQGITCSEFRDDKRGQGNEPHGWFYSLPCHQHALTPAPNSVFGEKFSALSNGGCGVTTSNVVTPSVQKRFLVFDQSRNQTSLIFSSVIGTAEHHSSNGTPKHLGTCGELLKDVNETKKDIIYQLGPQISKGFHENHQFGEESEMHEDTEELNALLYSDDDNSNDDDDDDDDDDEEASTGHSPSELTRYESRERVEGSAEEVASTGSPTKRRRLHDKSVMDTASSVKVNGSWDCKEEAELSCVNGRNRGEEIISSSGSKRKRERIRETVNILQKIIPGGKGKDAVLVLDEAIQYLTYLKFKAKAFGAASF